MSAVDVDSLLGELGQQRRDRAGISTTTINVVAFVEEDRRLLEKLQERTDDIAERHASRTILLDASARSTTHSVFSRCIEINDTVLTHSEHIALGAAGIAAPALRSIVHAMLVPNVRTVLLWAGDHLTDERFVELADLAHVVVIFSSASEHGVQPLRELLSMQHTPAAAKVRDIAYLRLNAWQDLIAQFFDDDELAAELPSISQVDVVCGSAPEAHYLVGWLASRLGWDPCGPREFCNAAGESIRIAVQIEGPPRRVQSIRLSTSHCVFGATIEKDADDLVCLTVEGEKHRPQRCLPLHDVDMISLIERAIFSEPDGGVYAQSLAMAGRFIEQSPSP